MNIQQTIFEKGQCGVPGAAGGEQKSSRVLSPTHGRCLISDTLWATQRREALGKGLNTQIGTRKSSYQPSSVTCSLSGVESPFTPLNPRPSQHPG